MSNNLYIFYSNININCNSRENEKTFFPYSIYLFGASDEKFVALVIRASVSDIKMPMKSIKVYEI